MKRKRMIAIVVSVFVVAAIAGGIWWYYEENIKITLPVDEKTAIRIGRAAIEEAFPEYLKSVSTYKSDMRFIADHRYREDAWYVKLYIDNLVGPVVYAYVDNATGDVIETGMLDEG